jgi:hypothetical protein
LRFFNSLAALVIDRTANSARILLVARHSGTFNQANRVPDENEPGSFGW